MRAPTLKAKKCKVCREEFIPLKPMQTVCGPACAYEIVKQAADKKAKQAKAEERKADKAKREQQKTLPTLKKEAQREFNRFIRLRDRLQPCICCGVPLGADVVALPGGFGHVDVRHYCDSHPMSRVLAFLRAMLR
jgi:hypothetical protein